LRNISTPGAHRLLRLAQPDDLDLVAGVDRALLDLAGDHRAPTVIVEHVSIGIKNGLSRSRSGSGIAVCGGLHQLEHLRLPVLVTLQRLQRGDADHGRVVAGELVLGEQLADHRARRGPTAPRPSTMSALLRGDDDVGHADLAGQQHVLPVWGIGPSVAATTRIAPSTCAAPVIMVLM
jgi:hypothetical protein